VLGDGFGPTDDDGPGSVSVAAESSAPGTGDELAPGAQAPSAIASAASVVTAPSAASVGTRIEPCGIPVRG
jgi:hypothetical protein